MKTTGIVSIGIIAVFACLLLCTTTSADYNFDGWSVETRTSSTVNGGVFVDYKPWAGTTTLTGNFNVPDGTVKWARLYTGVWGGNPTNTGWVNVTFNEISNIIHLQGESDTNPNVWCTSCGKYWMWFDVTSQTTAGSTNTATTSRIDGSIDGRVYGIVLVVVYEGGDNPKDIQYWINDGSDTLHHAYYPHPEKNVGTTDFAGSVDTGNVTRANLTMVHLTAYEPTCSNCLKFNNHPRDTSMITSNTIDLHSWDVESDIEASGNDAWFSRGEDPYVSITNAILVLEKAAAANPVRDMPESVNPGGDFNVTVTWTAPADDFNATGLYDEANATANMTVSGNTGWCTPNAINVNPVNNTIEYTWYGPYSSGTDFTAVYSVHVPTDAPEGSYTFNGELSYYIGGEGPFTEDVTGDSIIKVIKGIPISGLTGEVNCSIEPDVTITLYNKTTGDKVAETASDTNGNYTITAPCSGEYNVNVSKAGFKNESQEISITERVTSFNFRGEYGLTPEDPLMPYVLECVNHWLYPPEECGLTMAKALEVVNAWLY